MKSLAILAILAAGMAAIPAIAQPSQCHPADEFRAATLRGFGARPVLSLGDQRGRVLELHINPATGFWVLVQAIDGDTLCILNGGRQLILHAIRTVAPA